MKSAARALRLLCKSMPPPPLILNAPGACRCFISAARLWLRPPWNGSKTWDISASFCALQTSDLTVTEVISDSEKSSNLWSWNAIHSSLNEPSLSAAPGWAAVNTTTTERKPLLPLALSYRSFASPHNTSTGQAAIKPPHSPDGGVSRHEPQIYKLDFWAFTSPIELRRRRLCGLHARCNYNHLCQRCITYDSQELSCDACDPVTNERADG